MIRHATSFFGRLSALALLATLPLACIPTATTSEEPSSSGGVEEIPEETATAAVESSFLVTQSLDRIYVAGAEMTASISMNYTDEEPVTALALQIKLPLGWGFGTIVDGPVPAVAPKAGATDTVTLVWITTPSFPSTLSYTVLVPDWAEGTHALEAQAIYRGLGDELRSPISRVEAIAGP